MAKTTPGIIRVGIGGWTYAPWRGTFYPQDLTQKRELEYASRHLTSLEINGTFYGLQKPATFAKWRDETPDDFVFALKAPRFATNRRVLAEAGPSITRFLQSGVDALKEKLGPINWQFAPTKRFDPADFAAFLALLPTHLKGLPLRHAIEVRHESFSCTEFVDLARSREVAVVMSGDSAYPQIADLTGSFAYARIMGTSSTEKNGYSSRALGMWASRARAWAAGDAPSGLRYAATKRRGTTPRDVYLYVISGYKELNPSAAMALTDRVRKLKSSARSSDRR